MVVFEAKQFCKKCNKETIHRINPEQKNKSCNNCCEVFPIISDTIEYCMRYLREINPDICSTCSASNKLYGECYSYVKDIKVMKEELNAYKLLLKNSFFIALNANDFFGWACADVVELDICDLSWVIPIVQKYKDEGIGAVMSYIRKCEPLKPYQTEKFKQAYNELEELSPKVFSEEKV
jgi:hypothetical protein